jgi:crossover junction endodeoxyribonuclease RuvC
MKQIIIGFDPGLADTGFGVINVDGNRLSSLAYGSIKTPAKTEVSERLETIYKKVCEIIKEYKPDIVGIEKLFFSRNVTSALLVGQARGVVLLAIEQAGIPVIEFTPNQVKQAVSCYGAAGKSQVQKMVKMILNLKEIPKPDDAADGLAIAICAAGRR